MKHILTTNEPFLLERNDVRINVFEGLGIQFNDLPFINLTENIKTIFLKYLYTGYGSIKEPVIFAGYFEEEYSTTVSPSLSSKLGTLISERFTYGLTDSIFSVIFDLGLNKVYILDLTYSGNQVSSISVNSVYDFCFSTSQIYCREIKSFGTHIWFTLGLKQYKPLSGTSYTDEDPEYWVYSLEFKPLYWEKVRVQRQLVEFLVRRLESGQDVSVWESQTNTEYLAMYDMATWFYSETLNTIKTTGEVYAYLLPTIYWDLTSLGEISSTISFSDITSFPYSDIPSVRMMPITGKFISGINDLPIKVYDASLTFSDINPSIVSGHTYEFNIYDGVFNLIDITETTS